MLYVIQIKSAKIAVFDKTGYAVISTVELYTIVVHAPQKLLHQVKSSIPNSISQNLLLPSISTGNQKLS